MKLLHRSIIAFLLAAAMFSYSQASSDRTTLLTFKSMISDPSDALSSWADNTTLHFCQWQGVICGRKHPDRVTSLILDSLNLTGSLPPQVANLTFLRTLHLPSNTFRGSIPHEFGRLSRLTHLNLSYNNLDGEIPATLTRCFNLQFISLRNNQLSGKIPGDIGYLSQLKVLSLPDNKLIGTIPPSLTNLSSSLFYLDLHSNNLIGHIPGSFGKLSNLSYLEMSFNKLSGNIPSSLYNISSLETLGLQNNSFSGVLPSNMFNTLFNLQSLRLNYNQLEGHIPSSLPNATNLRNLEVGNNSLTGTIPGNLGNLPHLYLLLVSENYLEAKEARDWDFITSLANCSNLLKLALDENRLGGILPSSVANLSSTLKHLFMGQNQIAGSIPDGIGNLANLSILGLNNNLLSGSIPATIGKLQQLQGLGLFGNNFTGHIPTTIGNLTQINYLLIESNSLGGSIPVSLGKCQSLLLLDLSQNILTGAIPKEIVMLSLLSIHLYLSHNLLTGSLPSEVGQLTHLNALDISHNKLSGKIPATLGDCQSLEYLYMEENFFAGAIPRSLIKLKGLLELDLSHNNLSGNFPVYFGSLSGLRYLNLSYNDLDGEVPDEGILRNNTTQISVIGNKNLCGGSPNLHLPVCDNQYPKKKQHHTSLLLKVIIPVAIACLGMMIFFVICLARRRLKDQQKNSPYTSSIEGQFKQISYAELLQATDGFSPSNLIGVGSVGSVYKGVLNLGENTSVAVKVLNLEQRGASQSFMAECGVLGSIRHRNLVKILSSCSSVDFNGNDFKALVLEFMPNGSLEKWLHPIAEFHEHSEMIYLGLDERLNIAIDIASALEYLHHHCQTPIVHCDLKPSNILLDANMCAHVGDFGIARFMWEKLPGIDKQQITSTGIKGTIGYVAPEYGMGGQVSTYGDVYSYGILLLELFTGKRPTDEIFTNGVSLRNYVKVAFPERVMDIVDSTFHLFETSKKSQKNRKIGVEESRCLVSMIQIGLSCSKKDPRKRIEMKDVTRELHAIRNMLHKSEHMYRDEIKLGSDNQRLFN